VKPAFQIPVKYFPSGMIFFLALILCVSCRTLPPLPPVDFSAPGWRVQPGQAVWLPAKNRPEFTGDLLFGTNANGNFFITFTKTPFTLATAQAVNGDWQIAFGGNEYFWHGHGPPPARFGWFELPRALAGEKLESGWKFSGTDGAGWRLENPATGESLEGEFSP
jgi:hypothetical protein